MKIEQYWDDVDLYVIVYRNHVNEDNLLSKMIIVPAALDEESIRVRVKGAFTEIKEIHQIEYFSEGLYLKK